MAALPSWINYESKQKEKINSTIRCTDEYVYFYQDTPLSNWWVSEPPIEYDNHTFTSSEALFMYLKAKLFRDEYMADIIALMGGILA